MLELKTTAPSFNLIDVVTEKNVSLNDVRGEHGTLIIFMCNHCPFVVHIMEKLVELCAETQEKGMGVVAISSNDVMNYPIDSPGNMAILAKELEFSFPYLYDETQEVAKVYDAACTPDFYVFNKEDKLVYRGRMDESRPGNSIPVTGNDLRSAIDASINESKILEVQYPSMGCNIKWK
jgi:thiol-disulfide isomerase/thioredoxin